MKSPERGPHPVAGSRLFMLRDSCGSTASSRLENAWRPERGGGKEIMEVSHENRSRIGKLKVMWSLYRGNVAKFDKNRKDGGEGFFFFFCVLITRVEKERITNRILNIIVKCSERTLFPVYFYLLLFVWGWIRKLIQSYYIIIIIIIHLLLIWEKVNVWWCLMYHESIE